MRERPPGETHPVRRLLPDAGETTVAEQLDGLDLRPLAHPDRPYLVLNFATTLDGRAAISGKSGAIGSDTDTETLQRLRTRVDAVMIGAGTMRAERYGRIVSDPEFRAYRESTGLTHDPLAVIVSNRLELPWDARLFTDGGGEVRRVHRLRGRAAGDGHPGQLRERTPAASSSDRALHWLRHRARDPLGALRGRPDAPRAPREGGLADELFLTIAPKIAGGEGPRILEGALPDVDRGGPRLAAGVGRRALRPLSRDVVAFSRGLQSLARGRVPP